jgi:hypothetical protein
MRVAALLVTAAAALALPAAAVAAPPATQDSVKGSGVSPFFGSSTIDVRSGPSGENATGTASFTFEALTGTATCLAVRGNVATFNLDTVFGRVTFQVTDNAGKGVPDVLAGVGTARAAGDCSPLTEQAQVESLTSGDFVVVDARPHPPKKPPRCKHPRR